MSLDEHMEKFGDKDTWTLVMNNSHREDGEDKGAIAFQSKEQRQDDDLDADGIMVITDEESDTTESDEQTNITIESEQQQEPPKAQETQQGSPEAQPTLKKNPSLGDFDFYSYGLKGEELNDEYITSGTKVRSYIHKRNNKVSRMLNMILFGALIVTGCLAIGHVWGTMDNCSTEMTRSLTEFLYNTDKLEYENFVLKLQIKKLELVHSALGIDKLQNNLEDSEDNHYKSVIKNAMQILESNNCQCIQNSENKSPVEYDFLTANEKSTILDDSIEDVQIDDEDETLLRKKRSIESTVHNSFIGPKTYKDQLEGSRKKFFKNNGKYSSAPKGNLSKANNKNSMKDSKYSFDDNLKIRNEKDAKHKKNRKFESREWQERKNKYFGEARKGKKYADVEKNFNLKHDKNKKYKKEDKHQKSEFVS